MKDLRVARRYAAALFALAQRDEIADAIDKDLLLIERFLADVPYLRAVLVEPIVSEERKLKVVADAFGDRVTEASLSFLRLLIRKRREQLVGECIREYRALSLEHANMVDAEARSAVPLTPAQTGALQQNLEKMTGKTVRLTAVTDAATIGGVVVRIGDTIIDGSVQGRLQRLQQHLMGASALGGTV
jgi:F-type H+-transporting ATPase subunit delta